MTELRRAAAGMTALEEYAFSGSPLSRVHPRAKILAAVVYIVCAASFPAAGSRVEASGLVPYLLVSAALFSLSDIPFGALVKRLVPVLPFALMGGISNVFLMRKPAVVLGNFVISEGLVSFTAIMFKAVLCALAVLFLAGSTPFHTICAELRRLHVPAVFCVQLALMYRYIAVLTGEASAMFTAYILRSGGEVRRRAFGGAAFGKKAVRMKDMGFFLGRLVIRSIDKAGKVYNAMKCRGWTGEFHTGSKDRRMNAADYAYCLSVCGPSLFFRFFNLPRFLGNLVQGM